jgi:hypothetical protein
MSPERGQFVCGFGDVSAGLAGIAWDLGEPAAVLLAGGEARAATFALEEGGEAATLELTAGDVSIDATLAPLTGELALTGGPIAIVCRAEVRSEGGTVQCPGRICRWPANPLDGADTFRLIALDAGPDALLIATARGMPGARGHGEERTGGWRIQGEDVAAFEESLISTQYDGAGDPTRLAIELWAADADQTSRAAATRVSGSLLGGARRGGAWAGFFRSQTDGAEGLGSYLLWRE